MLEKENGTVLWRTMLAVLVFFLVALCMNGEALLRNAELMRYGVYRDVMIVLVKPFAGIARRGPGWLRANVEQGRDKYWEGVQ